MTNKVIGSVLVRGVEYNLILKDTNPPKVAFEKKVNTTEENN